MEIIKLSATKRSDQGKGASRRLRNEGRIPAVAYGGKLETLSLAVDPKALRAVLTSPHGKNSVVELDVEGHGKITAMVRQSAHHPVSRDLLHADFLKVELGQPVDVEVPLKVVGKSKGVVLGGLVSQVYRSLPVRSNPESIPALIEVDITELGLNEAIKVNQLVFPAGVAARLSPEQTVVSVVAPEKATPEEEEAAAKAALPAAGDKKAAAPAADKAKAKK